MRLAGNVRSSRSSMPCGLTRACTCRASPAGDARGVRRHQRRERANPLPHLASAGLLATFLAVPMLHAQSPVPVYREPLHRLVWEEGPVRVLDVQIAPGDTTLFHVHDTPMLAVRIAVSPVDVQVLGAGWGGVGPTDRTHFYPGAIDADTSYALRPVTHRVTNAGTAPFHLIGITNAGSGIVTGQSTSGSDLPGTIEHTSAWFQASRLAVPVGANGRWFSASTPQVLVQLSESRVDVERETGATTLLHGTASWVYLAAGTHYRIRNSGTAPGSLVFVAVR